MYKECGVVILATNQKARGQLTLNKDYPSPNANLLKIRNSSWFDSFTKNKWINQHLYITSDDRPKLGDYYIVRLFKVNENSVNGGILTIEQCKSIEDVWVNNHSVEACRHIDNCKKVIATTDTSLGYTDPRVSPVPNFCNLPKPPQSFIKDYIEEYNRGNVIDRVLVEYDEYHEEDTSRAYIIGKGQPAIKIQELVITSLNTINVKEGKDSWTKDEVHNLMMQAWIYGQSKPNALYTVREQWIKENL